MCMQYTTDFSFNGYKSENWRINIECLLDNKIRMENHKRNNIWN